MSTRIRRRLARAALVAATIGGLSSGLVLQQALAAQSSAPSDPVAHALGLDDATTRNKVQVAQERRGTSYRSYIAGCMQGAGFAGVPVAGSFAQYTAALSAGDQQRFAQAFTGQSGCEASATHQVLGTLLGAGDAYDQLETAMYNALAAKPSVKAAAAAWRTCMGQPTGFSNSSQIPQYLLDKRDAIAPSDTAALNALDREETRLNEADISCQHKVVDPVFQPLLRQAQSQMVASHASELAALRRALSS
jgi:hypothetical protein